MTDEELLRRASRGDESAFVALYERHRDAVFRFAYRMLGETGLAEDVAHDCFVGLIARPGRFDPGRASLRTYLFAAARNLSLKRFRRNGTEPLCNEDDVTPLAEEGLSPLAKLLGDELAVIVRDAIARLPPFQREAIVLFEYEDQSIAEIAAIVGASAGTVKVRLYRARQNLRCMLASYLEDSESCNAELGSDERRTRQPVGIR